MCHVLIELISVLSAVRLTECFAELPRRLELLYSSVASIPTRNSMGALPEGLPQLASDPNGKVGVIGGIGYERERGGLSSFVGWWGEGDGRVIICSFFSASPMQVSSTGYVGSINISLVKL